MASPDAGSSLTSIPRSIITLDDWHLANEEVPSTLILVRAWNGHYVQKCSYDAGEKRWRNQRGEYVHVIKWKFDR